MREINLLAGCCWSMALGHFFRNKPTATLQKQVNSHLVLTETSMNTSLGTAYKPGWQRLMDVELVGADKKLRPWWAGLLSLFRFSSALSWLLIAGCVGTFALHAQVGPGNAYSVYQTYMIFKPLSLPLPWTVELWVKRKDSSAESAPLFINSSGALKLEQYQANHKVGFTQFGVHDYSFDYVAPLNEWVHLTFVGQMGSTCLFTNGHLHSCIPAAIPLPLDYFGYLPGGPSFVDWLSCEVDEIRVWKIPRTEAQVQASISHPLSGNEVGLVEYWRCDEPQPSAYVTNSATYDLVHTAQHGFGRVKSGIPFVPEIALVHSSPSPDTTTLRGSVHPGNLPTTVWFRYGTQGKYEYNSTTNILPAGNQPQAIQADIPSSRNCQPQHWQIVAANAAGTTITSDQQFTATVAPIVMDRSSIEVTTNSAQLVGGVNPGGGDTLAWYRWGATTNYGHFTTPVAFTDPTNSQVYLPYPATMTGLQPGKLYYYQPMASNCAGVAFGEVASFQTPLPAVDLTGEVTNYWLTPFDPDLPDTTDWYVAANWSLGVVPQNTAAVKFHTVVESNSSTHNSVLVPRAVAVESLRNIDSDITVLSDLALGKGRLENGGNISLGASGADSRLWSPNDLQLNNPVALRRDGILSISSRSEVFSLKRIVNGVGHVLEGSGAITYQSLLNEGQIIANGWSAGSIYSTRQFLLKDTAGSPIVNRGLMRSEGPGFLRFQNAAIDNTNGVIEASNSSITSPGISLFDSVSVNGGFLTASSNGWVRLGTDKPFATGASFTGCTFSNGPEARIQFTLQARIEDCLFQSDLEWGNPGEAIRIDLGGNIHNSATQFFPGNGNPAAKIDLTKDTLLTGTGILHLAPNELVEGYSHSLTNDTQHTIEGAGQLGMSARLRLVNLGQIDANVATTVDDPYLNPGEVLALETGGFTLAGPSEMINLGELRASHGGKLRIDSSGLQLNSAPVRLHHEGTMRADGVENFPSTLMVNGPVYGNGQWSAEHGGRIVIASNAVVDVSGTLRATGGTGPFSSTVWVDGVVSGNGHWLAENGGTIHIGTNAALDLSSDFRVSSQVGSPPSLIVVEGAVHGPVQWLVERGGRLLMNHGADVGTSGEFDVAAGGILETHEQMLFSPVHGQPGAILVVNELTSFVDTLDWRGIVKFRPGGSLGTLEVIGDGTFYDPDLDSAPDENWVTVAGPLMPSVTGTDAPTIMRFDRMLLYMSSLETDIYGPGQSDVIEVRHFFGTEDAKLNLHFHYDPLTNHVYEIIRARNPQTSILTNLDSVQFSNVQRLNSALGHYVDDKYMADVHFAANGITVDNVRLISSLKVPPTITTQPVGRTNVAGFSVNFGVSASGTQPLIYQWFKDLTPITGATNDTLILTNVSSYNTGVYFVIVTNEAGSVTSSTATLAVLNPPVITSQPVASTNVAGTTASFTVVATGSAPLTYQWFKDNSRLPGANSATLTLPNVSTANVGSYTVTITNMAGSVTSTGSTLTVLTPPVVISQPASVTNWVGTTARLIVVAEGSPLLSYQWFKDSLPIMGATAPNLTLPNISSADAGRYAVTISNFAGVTVSAFATITVMDAPSAPTLTISSGNGKAVHVTFTAYPERHYEIQATPDLKDWKTIWQSSVVTEPTDLEFSDSTAQDSNRFYRLIQR